MPACVLCTLLLLVPVINQIELHSVQCWLLYGVDAAALYLSFCSLLLLLIILC